MAVRLSTAWAYALAALVAATALLAAAPAADARFSRVGAGVSLTERAPLMHGVAGDKNFIFVTEPAVERPGAEPQVVALDRDTGRRVAALPSPPGGFKFPFTLRVARSGRLAVLDNAGWPPQGAPKVYEYRYKATRRGGLSASLAHTADFSGLPLFFAEDVEALPGGRYVVSESIVGGFWVIEPNWTVRPGLLPSGPQPLPELGPCVWPSGLSVGGLAFAPPNDLAPGVGSMAVRNGKLYFGSSCRGGLHSIRVSTLLDATKPGEQRVSEIKTVSPKPADVPAETLKGLSFNRWSKKDKNIYVGDPLRLRLLKVNPRTGKRSVVSSNDRAFDFTVATTFLPPRKRGGAAPLIAVSDQEYRWGGLNLALAGQNAFRTPFVLTKVFPSRTKR